MNALIALLSRFFAKKPEAPKAQPFLHVVLDKASDGSIILPDSVEYRGAFKAVAYAIACIPSDGYAGRNEFLTVRNLQTVKARKRRKSQRLKVKASRRRNR